MMHLLPLLYVLSTPAYVIVMVVLCYGRMPVSRLVALSLIMPAANCIMGYGLTATLWRPDVYDPVLARLDGAVGQPSIIVSHIFKASDALAFVCMVTYCLLPAGIAFAAAHELRSGTVQGRGVLQTFIVAGICGYAVYFCVPVIGPSPYFAIPGIAQTAKDLTLYPAADILMPRNCVPSLHASWTALAFLATRNRSRQVRTASGLFFIFTVLATLGFGAHYLVDLVVAAPFVLFVRAVCTDPLPWRGERASCALLGLGSVIAWCLVIRGGGSPLLSTPAGVPVAMLATVVVAVIAERWLAEAEGCGVRVQAGMPEPQPSTV